MALVDGDKTCGCSQGHLSFGACVRAKNLQAQPGESHRAVQAWDSRLSDFAKCVTNGLAPKSTKRVDVDTALRTLRGQRD